MSLTYIEIRNQFIQDITRFKTISEENAQAIVRHVEEKIADLDTRKLYMLKLGSIYLSLPGWLRTTEFEKIRKRLQPSAVLSKMPDIEEVADMCEIIDRYSAREMENTRRDLREELRRIKRDRLGKPRGAKRLLN